MCVCVCVCPNYGSEVQEVMLSSVDVSNVSGSYTTNQRR